MKNFVKYLEILIDFDLSWKNHIDLICQKIRKTLGILARPRHSIPISAFLKIYQALITPYLDYGICVLYNRIPFSNLLVLADMCKPVSLFSASVEMHYTYIISNLTI